MKETIIHYEKGIVMGYLDHRENGDVIATGPTGKILGYYYADLNITMSSSGRKLFKGNMASCLIFLYGDEK